MCEGGEQGLVRGLEACGLLSTRLVGKSGFESPEFDYKESR
jgi:hypothetical protein